jgi:hypothetical protein
MVMMDFDQAGDIVSTGDTQRSDNAATPPARLHFELRKNSMAIDRHCWSNNWMGEHGGER